MISPSRLNFQGSIDSCFEQFALERNVVIAAPCFSIVPLFLETTDTIAFLPSRALVNSNLAIIKSDLPTRKPESTPVGISVW